MSWRDDLYSPEEISMQQEIRRLRGVCRELSEENENLRKMLQSVTDNGKQVANLTNYVCPICGNEEILQGQNYCQICGTKLSGERTEFIEITEEEYHQLKAGDIVYLYVSAEYHESTVLAAPFWNCDADEPDWEVLTSNGYADRSSLRKKLNL